MKNSKRKGFTIVELVIVIAVIAILAAVLIPMFSNIIKKSQLSADKQAVRAMNEALAQYEASNGYNVITDIDACMQVLANAGYNTENWTCITNGYQVYWYKNDNRMILYNATTAEIEYPEEYVGTKTMVTPENNFFIYNYNHVKAQQFEMSLGSSTSSGTTSFSSVTVKKAEGAIHSNSTENMNTLSSTISSNEAVKSSLVSAYNRNMNSKYASQKTDNIYMYAAREVVSASQGNTYVSLQVAAVGTTENPVVFKSNGDIVENLFLLSIVTEGGGTPDATQLANAQKQAGEYIYNIFDQITTGKVEDFVTIIVAPGTQIDCSTCEWAPCKTFEGYFGTTDAKKPVIINGARLSEATGYSATYQFTGDNSKYFLTGFFGTVYGNTTIENVTFTNITIDSPATDWKKTTYADKAKEAGKGNNRNTVGIIGGIIDGWNGSGYTAGNVTLRNIKVESGCNITGDGCVGGLIGYIGSGNGDYKAGDTGNWSVTLDNCAVSATVKSLDQASSTSYRKAGGLVGFLCRSHQVDLVIRDCTFNGSVDGYGSAAPAVGEVQYARSVTFEGTNDFANAKINKAGTAVSNQVAGVMYGAMTESEESYSNLNISGTIKTPEGLNTVWVYNDATAHGTPQDLTLRWNLGTQELAQNGTFDFKNAISKLTDTTGFTYSSADAEKVTVSEEGVITNNNADKVVVTATLTEGGKTIKTVKITITTKAN